MRNKREPTLNRGLQLLFKQLLSRVKNALQFITSYQTYERHHGLWATKDTGPHSQNESITILRINCLHIHENVSSSNVSQVGTKSMCRAV